MTIFGCDNDDEPGAFTSAADPCGNDPDTASVSYDIRTYKTMERWILPVTPFNLYANGSSLKFRVEGSYHRDCSPCPDGVEGVLLLDVQEPETLIIDVPPPGEEK